MNSPDYAVDTLGREQQPVVIIDDFSSAFPALKAAAASQSFQPRGAFYPGVRAPAQVNYLAERLNLLTSIIKEVFGLTAGMRILECNFSLVTTPPADLAPIQCLPHFDGVDPGRLALLHYLCSEEQGGTAFYRHKATGYETVTSGRFDAYKAALEAEAETLGLPPKRYFCEEDSAQFERIGTVKARPNRLIIYRSITLHSGDIQPDFTPDVDPRTGRLTINTFFQSK